VVPESEVSIAFELTSGQLWRVGMGILWHRPKALAFLIGVPVVGALVISVLQNSDQATTLGLIVGYLALMFLVVVVMSLIGARRNWSGRQTRIMTFDQSGVSVKKADTETKVAWSAFDRIRTTRTGYLLTMRQAQVFYWIPFGAFTSTDQRSAFSEIVATHLN
jgi:hypothetical protein